MVVGWEWENGSEDRGMLAARSKHVFLLLQEVLSTQTGMLTPSREHGTTMQKVALTRPIPDRPGEGSSKGQELFEADGEGGEGEMLSCVALQSLAKGLAGGGLGDHPVEIGGEVGGGMALAALALCTCFHREFAGHRKLFTEAALGIADGKCAGEHGFRQNAAEALVDRGLGIEPGIPLAKPVSG